jgi:hypothetical protein
VGPRCNLEAERACFSFLGDFKTYTSQVLVAGSKSARANNSQDPISKKNHKNRTGGVAQGVGPEFKPQYCKSINQSINQSMLTYEKGRTR